jgi:hypothetical protein
MLPSCARKNRVQTESVNLDRIRERLENGFKPFVLELSSGRRVPVPHPDFIMVGKGVVVVMGRDDSITTVDSLHITAMKDWHSAHKRK